jgi:putative MATE family efflux protein
MKTEPVLAKIVGEYWVWGEVRLNVRLDPNPSLPRATIGFIMHPEYGQAFQSSAVCSRTAGLEQVVAQAILTAGAAKEPPISGDRKVTKGVKILLGDPKKAIIRLALPMVVAMSFQTLYNLADAIWVSGKGPDSLSAVGFTFPFFFLAMALANGIGVGGGSAISRRIGANDRIGADKVATHSIVSSLLCGGVTCVVMLILLPRAMEFMGAGSALRLSIHYSRIIFLGMPFLFFNASAVSILRSEGDARRAMVAMALGGVLNIILDPIFIYGLDLGVIGAAIATILSMFFTALLTLYWLLIQKKTFVRFKFKGFRFDGAILYDIGRVGLPASVSQMSMSLMAFLLTTIIAKVGGTVGVAVYTSGWRIVSIATLPMLGVASAVTAVTGAAFGASEYEKARTAYFYALKTGVLVEMVLAVLVIAFAHQITWIFTWSEESQMLVPELVKFLRILWIVLPTAPVGMLSSGLFQGTGKGIFALGATMIRTIVFTVPFAWILGIHFDQGLYGVWIGMAAAGVAYMPVVFTWANLYLKRLMLAP